MKNKITIKAAQICDTAKIAEIEKECFAEPWSDNSVKEFILCPENTILCAFCDNALCGYISETHVLDEIQIANVAVTDKYRRFGIASALIESLIDKCISQKVSLITLEVRKSNIPAIRLYEKFEFSAEGIRKKFYKNPTEDAIIMNRHFNKGK